jgi:hypothetical protein
MALPAILGVILKIGGPLILEQVKKEIAKNPETKNAVNAEAPYQSRVAVGATMSGLPAVFYCLYAAFAYGADGSKYIEDPMLMLAVPAAAGAIYTLYGRFKSGLKPLFNKD